MNNRINDPITQAYIDQYLERGRKVRYDALTAEDNVRTYFYDELPAIDAVGYPMSSDYVLDGTAYNMRSLSALDEETQKKCRLRYYYMPCYHELYVGTTGSGKTTGCVEPQLRAVAMQRNKPHLFFTDPKGELYDRNAFFLKEQGYRLFVLNFKNLSRSDRWNPLGELYDLNYKATHTKKYISHVAVADLPASIADSLEGIRGSHCFLYEGQAYADYAEASAAAALDSDVISVEIDSVLSQLANMLIPAKDTTDLMWIFGAQDALKGILYAMLEDAADPAFTRDMMSIKTVNDYYRVLRDDIVSSERYTLQTHPLLKGKSHRVISHLTAMFDSAEGTKKSYCAVFENSLHDWFSGHIMTLTTGNTVDLEAEDGSPFAVFVVTRDYEKSDFKVAGLFIDWVYRTMLRSYEEGRNRRAVHFMLDEFGNVPAIPDFENKIATARSREIWFHLVVQSYRQIDAVYGELHACIIRDNCNMQVFLGSQNHQTKREFSDECGNYYVPSLNSRFDARVHQIVSVPLVPTSDLEYIEVGQAIIKRLRSPVIFAEYIRSYVAGGLGTFAHFADKHALLSLLPRNLASFNSAQFTYTKVAKARKKAVDADIFRF